MKGEKKVDKKRWIYRGIVFAFLLFVYVMENRYKFLILNVVLAYIPLELSWFSQRFNNGILFWVSSLLWLLFYPNAPYMLTDTFHLTAFHMNMSDPVIYFHFMILTVGIVLGVCLGLQSLNNMSRLIMKKLKTRSLVVYSIWLGSVSLLTGYAVYLGRFVRLHTAHLFVSPISTLKEMLGSFTPQALSFILSYAGLHLFVVVLYHLSTTRRLGD